MGGCVAALFEGGLQTMHTWHVGGLLCRLLENKLIEAKSKKDTLKARAKSAATSKQINDMISGLNTSNAAVAFDKMEEKVMALEAEAEATMQVNFAAWPKIYVSQGRACMCVCASALARAHTCHLNGRLEL
jgi:PspA/IM30 family